MPDRATMPGPARTLVAAILSSALAFMPVFLMGSLGALVRDDLAFSEVRLGMAVSASFLAAALAAVPSGRYVQRIGAWRGMTASTVIVAVSLVGIAATARSWAALVAWLVVAGVGNALSQPAADLALARAISPGRLGTAFGLRTGNVPLGTVVAGLSVPVIGLTFGWRLAVASALVLALGYALVMRGDALLRPSAAAETEAQGHTDLPLSALVMLALVLAIGIGTQHAVTTFYALSAISFGHPVGLAGILLAVGGVAAGLGRFAWGVLSDGDRRSPSMMTVALLLVGALGVATLGMARSPIVLTAATLVAFGAGSGWNGLLGFAIVRSSLAQPARAMGVVMVGAFGGGILGPVGVGLLIDAYGYRVAWRVGAVAMVAAAVLTLVCRPRLDRPRTVAG